MPVTSTSWLPALGLVKTALALATVSWSPAILPLKSAKAVPYNVAVVLPSYTRGSMPRLPTEVMVFGVMV